MRNSHSPGDVLELTAPIGGVSSGDVVTIGPLIAIAVNDAEAGAKFMAETSGVFSLAKVSAEAWEEGDVVYWDAGAKQATSVAGDTALGVVVTAASNPSSHGLILLKQKPVDGGGGTPGGNPNEFQYNNAGAFGGASNLVVNGDLISMGTLPLHSNMGSGITVSGHGSDPSVGIHIENGGGSTPTLSFTGHEGNGGAAAPTGNGDYIGYISANGFNGTNWIAGCEIIFDAPATWSALVYPARITLKTVGAERMRIDEAGLVRVTGTLNVTTNYQANGTPGVSGSFTTNDGKTVTVTNGLITAIV